VGKGAGLARPWAREQKQRAGAVGDGLLLLRRKAGEQALGSGLGDGIPLSSFDEQMVAQAVPRAQP